MRLVVGLLVVLVGCAAEDPADDDDAGVVDGKADGVTEFKLSLTSTLRAKTTPKLPGAPAGSATFACTEGRTAEGWRLLCTRGQEQLTLTYGPDEKAGAAIYKKTAASPDRRAYYHCAATAAAANAWPTELQCTAKQPKTIISGQLVSPFASSIDGVGIFNAHAVAGKVYRGMKPFRDDDFTDLQGLGIDAVLIFKKPTSSTEVDEENDALNAVGITESANIPFLWKDFPNFKEACVQTVTSLRLLHTWTKAGKTAFVHCTVGEDRTGYIAGLYRLMTETASVREIFDGELCERGYSSGNPQKPYLAVAKEVDADLTPIFLKMAFKIRKGEITPTSLSESVCDVDPTNDPAFADAAWQATSFRCAPSSRYRL